MTGDRTPIGGQNSPDSAMLLGVFSSGVLLAAFSLAMIIATAERLVSGHFLAAGVTAPVAAVCGALSAVYLRGSRPQRAWLEGTVLAVERAREVRRCDLATAAVIRMGSAWPSVQHGVVMLRVLSARERPDSPPVRLGLHGYDRHPLPSADLRMLADVIDRRPAPHDDRAGQVVRRLRALADERDARTTHVPADWSHRTDPEGLNRPGGG